VEARPKNTEPNLIVTLEIATCDLYGALNESAKEIDVQTRIRKWTRKGPEGKGVRGISGTQLELLFIALS
jgi:hypothetical protein